MKFTFTENDFHFLQMLQVRIPQKYAHLPIVKRLAGNLGSSNDSGKA